MRVAGTILLVGALVFSAGCVGFSGVEPTSQCPTTGGDLWSLPLDDPGRQTDPRQRWDALVVTEAGSPFEVAAQPPPAGWHAKVDALPAGTDPPAVWTYELTPTPSARGGQAGFEARRHLDLLPSCEQKWQHAKSFTLAAPTPGELAAPGKAAHVRTAGFWPNGTLFYTNMDEAHNSTLPRAGWYSFGGGAPLPVYVYDKDRNERSPHWSFGASGPAPIGARYLWNYATTIEGFNEALKGLSTTTSRVVFIPPEKAYTLPGRESHPLYGDPLIFFIKLERVVEVPCTPATAIPCDVNPSPGL